MLEEAIDEMDLTALYRTYSHLGRKSATTPRTLLKVIIYAAMEGEYSSRNIHSACKRDINYIWLLNGEEAPSYHEISRFRSTRLSCFDIRYVIGVMPYFMFNDARRFVDFEFLIFGRMRIIKSKLF